MKKSYRHKYAWGTLEIRADFSKAGDLIFYRTDTSDWDCTPFEVHNCGHDPKRALSIVNEWLGSQAG